LKVIHFTEDGRQIYLDEMVPGDYFGETGLLCEGVRTSSIVAEEATKVFMLGRDAFLSVLYSKPAVSEKIRLMIRKRQEKNQAMMHIALGRKNVPEGKKENPLNRIIGKK
jgi:CRP-like cAMP-binding protein